MNIPWQGQLLTQPRLLLEEAGYHEFRDPNTDKISYVMRLRGGFYPRYHVYINKQSEAGGVFSLHLDQKKASYEGQRAHSGEYDGPLVEEEAARLTRWIQHYQQQ